MFEGPHGRDAIDDARSRRDVGINVENRARDRERPRPNCAEKDLVDAVNRWAGLLHRRERGRLRA